MTRWLLWDKVCDFSVFTNNFCSRGSTEMVMKILLTTLQRDLSRKKFTFFSLSLSKVYPGPPWKHTYNHGLDV